MDKPGRRMINGRDRAPLIDGGKPLRGMGRGGIRKGKPYAVPGKRLVTMTFADAGENEHGMEILGHEAPPEAALTVPELRQWGKQLRDERALDARMFSLRRQLQDRPGADAERIARIVETDPVPRAGLLFVRGLAGKERTRDVEEQLWDMPIDTCALQGRGINRYVKNKHGRHNNCITDRAVRAPSIANKDHYADGMGSVVAMEDYPLIGSLRDELSELVGRPLPVLENNYYYEVDKRKKNKNGIGWHGDKERRITILYRVGEASVLMPLRFQWFYDYKPIGPVLELHLQSGDIVFMCGKANGKDWDDGPKKRWTLRHATGAGFSESKAPDSEIVRLC